jgi:hypothetical protein
MRKVSWVLILTCLCAVVSAPFVGGARSQRLESSAASGVSQWTVFGPAAFWPFPGRAFGLFNNYNQKSLRYEQRDNGINLGWDDKSPGRNITFSRKGTSRQAFVFGEPIAIYVSGGGYLRYKKRDTGINLDWSATPEYEWEFTGGTPGTRVRGENQTEVIQRLKQSSWRVRLYNRIHGDYLLYGGRDQGINLRWYADEINGGKYPPVPFPPQFRSPSGEPGQVLLGGNAVKTVLYHGSSDRELDWHIYIRPDNSTRAAITSHLNDHARGAQCAHIGPSGCSPLLETDLKLYTEWMVLDGYLNATIDQRFYSADVTRLLGLSKPAWSYSVEASQHQGTDICSSCRKESRLVESRARVYLQGPLVNDAYHGFRLEIHPLDSAAYALDPNGRPLKIDEDGRDWPSRRLTWRVAAFTNSTAHRINSAEYLNKERTTTWYLPLPRLARDSRADVNVTVNTDGLFELYPVAHDVSQIFLKRRPGIAPTYRTYGIRDWSYAIERDPTDRKRKLRVTIKTAKPDFWGAMFQRDFTITVE